jgi:hypothetical protein
VPQDPVVSGSVEVGDHILTFEEVRRRA